MGGAMRMREKLDEKLRIISNKRGHRDQNGLYLPILVCHLNTKAEESMIV